ncbi:MAG TPA: hypothetical protein PK969_03015 [Treponemataceae bacterium]|nr:hypothetical protein [Treponemataceae bacterium]
MKESRKRIPPVPFSVPFIVFIIILVSVGLFILSDIGGKGIFSAVLFASPRGIVVLVAIPFALLCFTGIFLYMTIIDTLSRHEITKIGMRIFMSFCLLILFTGIPVTVTIGRFAGNALSAWFTRELSSSLLSATDIARLYTGERHRVLEKAAIKYFNGLAITTYIKYPTDWMSDIRTIDPFAAACQVYAMDRKNPGTPVAVPVHESGDSGAFVPPGSLVLVSDGLFSLEPGEAVNRYGRVVRYNGVEYICVLTSALPEGFSARIRAIELAYSQSLVIDGLKPYLPVMGVWIFALFCLPLLFLLVSLAWTMSMKIALPAKPVSNLASRLSVRDSSFRVIPHGSDELSIIGQHLNGLASSQKPDTHAEALQPGAGLNQDSPSGSKARKKNSIQLKQ